jgi:L-lactate dehydrogenase complex protein LldE
MNKSGNSLPMLKVQLFVTCLVDSLFPEAGEAVVQVLSRAGAQVEFPPDQTCCGQPAFNAGFHPEARRMAMHTIEVLEKTAGAVVVPSGSCASMIRHGYAELFENDPHWLPRAQALAERTFEFSQYLVDILQVSDLQVQNPQRFAYHPSCHLLRGLGVEQQPLSLLESVGGAHISALEPECCGFGGIFAVDHEEISTQMLERKLAQIDTTQAEAVVACDVSCLMHIEGGLRKRGSPVRCMHLAQVLDGQGAGLR